MTSPPEVGRKVRQLDNDVVSIYDLLDELRGDVRRIAGSQLRHTSRLDHVEDRLHGVETKLATVDDRLTSIDDRVAGIDTQLTTLDGKLDRIIQLVDRPSS